jgi:hypothetical protein
MLMSRLRGAFLLACLAVVMAGILSAAPAKAAPYGWAWPSTHVTVSDQTGAGWPVSNAVIAWNAKNSPMHLTYTRATCTGCIHVTEVSYIPCDSCGLSSYIAGNTDWTFTAGVPTDAYVTLSNLTGHDGCRRGAVATHELGHAIGLGHYPDGTRSIMQTPWSSGDPCAPTSLDYRDLKQIYGR